MSITTFHLIIVLGSQLIALFFFLFWDHFGPLESITRNPNTLRVLTALTVGFVITAAVTFAVAEDGALNHRGMSAVLLAFVCGTIAAGLAMRGVRWEA